MDFIFDFVIKPLIICSLAGKGLSMGNAFTALGGDLGAIGINPASSGVYKYNEVTFTPAFSTISIESHFLGNSTKESKTTFGIANIGGIANINTGRKNYGLVSWDFGLVYNKVNNFNSTLSARGTNSGSSYLGAVADYSKGSSGYNMLFLKTILSYSIRITLCAAVHYRHLR